MKKGHKVLLVVLMGIVGATISRWHGGGFKSVVKYSNKTVKNIVWAAPLGAMSLTALMTVWPWYWATLGALVATVFCVLGKATGHGRVWNPFVPLDLTEEPEKMEWPIQWLQGRISDMSYKLIAMSLIGFAAVSGAAFAFGYVYPLAGVIVALGGILGKACGYLMGWELKRPLNSSPYEDFDEPTEFGELFTGLISYTLGTLAWLMIVA